MAVADAAREYQSRLYREPRRLLESGWFRQRWPHVRLARNQSAKLDFHNTKRGVMVATSIGGSVTGRVGHRLVVDDPHSPDQAESDRLRQGTIDRFRMGACPGSEESAGPNFSHRCPKGNQQMRRVLNQAANAAVKAKGTIF